MSRLKSFFLMVLANVLHHMYLVPALENSKSAGVLGFILSLIIGLLLIVSFFRLFKVSTGSGGSSSGGDSWDFDFGGGDGGGGGD